MIYNRFIRWSRHDFWVNLLDALVDVGEVTKSIVIDNTYIKAQRTAFGGKGGGKPKQSVARVVVRRPRFTRLPTSSAVSMSCRSQLIPDWTFPMFPQNIVERLRH